MRNFSPDERKTDKVIKMVKSGPKPKVKDLLILWRGQNNAELPFSEIVKIAKEQLGLKKRTVINYLNTLVEQQILEKRVDSKRNTFYKPKNKVELKKAIIKSIIDDIDDEKLLSWLDIYSLIFLAESRKRAKQGKTPEYFEIVELAKKRILEVRKAQKMIDEAIKEMILEKKSKVSKVSE